MDISEASANDGGEGNGRARPGEGQTVKKGMAKIVSIRRKRFGFHFREALDAYLFIMPWILGFIAFTAGPMLASLYFSFTKYEVLTPPKWRGLYNYGRMIHDPLLWKSLYNTAYYVFFGVPGRLIVALTFAIILNQKIWSMPIYRALFYLPSVVPVVASAILWLWVFNPDYGLANSVLDFFGLPLQKWLWDVNLAKPCFVLLAMWHFGSQMVIFLAGLQSIPKPLYEAATIDGANRWQLFKSVTIPLLTPMIFFNLIMAIITSFQVFTTAFIATGGGPRNATLFYLLYLYRNAFEWFRMGYASAMAWILFLIILALTLIDFLLAKRWVYYEAETL